MTEVEEKLVRLVEKMAYNILIMYCLSMGIAIAILLVMIVKGNTELKQAEEELARTEAELGSSFMEERIPLKEQIRYDMKNLPMPEIEVTEVVSEETTEEITEITEVPEIEVEEPETLVALGSEEEVLLLAQLMHSEEGVLCRDLPLEQAKLAHMLAGSVVIHRRNMHYMGAKTIHDVIYTTGQYDCLEKLNQKVPERTIEWARELLTNGPLGPEDLIYQSEFPQGHSVVEGDTTYAHIGNQYFCTDQPITE